ncbi:MarR family transcriptional regulator [Acidaminococcus sp. NSJ-142]|jgi:DNA-binding MarR family transcriptional regulator|uniref:MarR family winged helix-turn-helix transcriptional regulator n=1 Tax=Acidaminococcus TaxID=904 RepID=UPI000CF8BB95|nr:MULTISPECIES: MarR family transcriptional regulator [Acidaminococcus]MCD2436270.1 MarR family transcriptional regulator [Acidaminococcus hominis]MCH4095194.1 MarR family transcriptional regulator [Acidaminococcus provencensis]RHK03513.1 MarR family transcriptional regulator [Acidaminococcus sp. AM05-11]
MTSENEYAGLLLQNQLCFPLYAAARKIVAAYHPLLKALDLTYAQYVTLMVLWEEKEISMHQLGKRLYLDSGTLTPVLKKLEAAGYIRRYRDPQDERNLIAALTDQGLALRDKAKTIPHAMTCKLNQKGTLFSPEEMAQLKKELYALIAALDS